MKKGIITFEITSEKTEVTCVGISGNIDKMDITGTDVEKKFVTLLKDLQEHQLAIEVMPDLDIDKWEKV